MNTIEAINILKSNKCRCGNLKGVRTAFCRDCYFSLSPRSRKALYQRIGCGFEQAYESAEKALVQKGDGN